MFINKVIPLPRTTALLHKSRSYVHEQIFYAIMTLETITKKSLTTSSKNTFLGEIGTALEFLFRQQNNYQVTDEEVCSIAHEHRKDLSPILYEFFTEVFPNNDMDTYERFFERERSENNNRTPHTT